MRSASGADSARRVNSNGDSSYPSVGSGSGVALGFCLSPKSDADFKASLDAGTAESDFPVGSAFVMEGGDNIGTVKCRVLGYGVDELADSSGNAEVTLEIENLLPNNHKWNPSKVANTEGTGTLGGYAKSELNTYIEGLITSIPETLRNNIVEVKKYSTGYNASDESKSTDMASTHKLWALSYREVFGGTSHETTGPIYSDVFKDADSRKKFKSGASSANYWWLRSAYDASSARQVSNFGNYNDYYVDYSNGVALGFCLKSSRS